MTNESDEFVNPAESASRAGEQGSLADIVRFEWRQVTRLSLLFALWMLLPLALLLVAQQHVGAANLPDQLASFWGVLCVSVVILLSLALAFSIARQQSLTQALDRAISSLPLQFAYIDTNRCYRFNNRAHLQKCARSTPVSQRQSVREVVGETTYRQIEPHLNQALNGKRTDFELQLENGEQIQDISVSYLPDIGQDGKVKGLFVLADDITARKQAALRDREQLLEFAHLSRMASIGEVAAEIAHQINQPLAAIAMFSNAAQRTLAAGGDQTQVRDWLETINGQSKRASDVIGSLRRFVRPGKMETVALDLNQPLRDVATLLTHDAAAHQIVLVLDLADDLPLVMATSNLIEQVVFNLASNAIRATCGLSADGQVTIRSRADAEWVWVEVFGNGSAPSLCLGLDADNAEPAQQEAGIGFNLLIIRSIIEGFDGEAGCRADVSGASICHFKLPRCKA